MPQTATTITREMLRGWDSFDDITTTLSYCGFEHAPDIEEIEQQSDEQLLRIKEDQYLAIIEAADDMSAQDYNSRLTSVRRANLIVRDDFSTFTLVRRTFDFSKATQIKHEQRTFYKHQFQQGGDSRSLVEQWNECQFGNPDPLGPLFDDRRVVAKFYEEFQEIRNELIENVVGIPEDQEDEREKFVQVLLDRLIFLHFLQEKGLLSNDDQFLSSLLEEAIEEDEDYLNDHLTDIFYNYLSDDHDSTPYGELPYLNGGLFKKIDVERKYSSIKLGDSVENSNEQFERLLNFLEQWNWEVDERLGIHDRKNLSPEILGHIFEQTVNQKQTGAYYTPEEVTRSMSVQTIEPYLEEQLADEHGFDIESLSALFGIHNADDATTYGDTADVQLGPLDQRNYDAIEILYFDILKELKLVDPAVGSGAFLLAAEDVLLSWRLCCLAHFRELYREEPWEVTGRVQNELEEINNSQASEILFSKHQIILDNLYGVDIDEGGVEICKLRLWLSMVADIENNIDEVQKLPNIDYNILSGDSLIGFKASKVDINGQEKLITNLIKNELEEYVDTRRDYKYPERSNHDDSIEDLDERLSSLRSEMRNKLNGWYSDIPNIDVEQPVDGPEDLEASLKNTQGKSVVLKFRTNDPIPEFDSLKEDLRDVGFNTWKYAANLEVTNDTILAGYHETAFDLVSDIDLTECYIERGLIESEVAEMNPFHWVMEFPEVFWDRDDPGFDILLENPPYVRVENMQDTPIKKDLYKEIYKSAHERFDLYVPFLERSFSLLSSRGKLGIITSNQFKVTDYGEKIRGILAQDTGIESIYDFTTYSVFEGITIYSMILIGESNPSSDLIDCTSIRGADGVQAMKQMGLKQSEDDQIFRFTVPRDSLDNREWLLLSDAERGVLESVDAQSDTRLGADDSSHHQFTIGSPLKTGRDPILRATIQQENSDTFVIENDYISGTVKKGIWKKMIIPEDITRFGQPDPNDVIFFPYQSNNGDYELISESEFSSDYTETYELLSESEVKSKLLDRRDSGRSLRQRGDTWYKLMRRGEPDNFELDKIVAESVINEPRFAIDRNGYLFASGGAGTQGITPLDSDLFYTVAYLNSAPVFKFMKQYSQPKQNGYLSLNIGVLERVPFVEATFDTSTLNDVRSVLDSASDADFAGLRAAIETADSPSDLDGIEDGTGYAAIMREVARYIITEDCSESAVENLEAINDEAALSLFDLSSEERASVVDI